MRRIKRDSEKAELEPYRFIVWPAPKRNGHILWENDIRIDRIRKLTLNIQDYSETTGTDVDRGRAIYDYYIIKVVVSIYRENQFVVDIYYKGFAFLRGSLQCQTVPQEFDSYERAEAYILNTLKHEWTEMKRRYLIGCLTETSTTISRDEQLYRKENGLKEA